MLLILAALTLVFTYLYFVFTTPFWDKFEIPYLKPNPFFGNLTDVVFQKASLVDVYNRIYRKFKNSAYVGIYIIRRPGILIRDIDLAKDVLIGNFSHFHENDLEVDPEYDPIFGNNPFTMKGEEWKIQRTKHVPLYTIAKMKNMFESVKDSSEKLVKYLKEHTVKNSCVEAMDISAKYTISNVGSCAIGIDNRTLEEKNSEMRQMGKDLVEISIYNSIKQFLMIVIPSVFDFFKVTLVPTKVYKRLKSIIIEQIDYRNKNNVKRNDFFDNIRKPKGKGAELEEIIAHVGGFFVDGFATSSHALNFTLYEIAKNVDVQRKLRKEIDETISKNNGKITYDILNEMVYLEAVILESLRKYPPLGSMTKLCTSPFTLPPATPASNPIKIQVGTPVVIPLMAIQNDDKYYPNPEKFDPSRLLPGNKEFIEKKAFMPFSTGPRACIGQKFALMQAKMCIFKLLEHFKLKVNSKTREPIMLHPAAVLITAKGGIWLDVTKRK
nr:cytochrome P450 6j1-like [Onthophagus taurus]